jgi:hypothetical protein
MANGNAQASPMEIPPEILRLLAQRMGQAGGAMGGGQGAPGMPLPRVGPGGTPPFRPPQGGPQSTAQPAYNIKSDPRANIGSLPQPVQRPNPTEFQGSGPIGALISLLGNWHSSKQKSENVEAANASHALMEAIEGAKQSGDWTPAYTILHNNEKLFNKVYKGWLQKNEMQAQEKEKKSKSKPPDPDVQGFEAGVQSFLQKKQQPQGPPPQGSAPKALGGYQLPQAPPAQAQAQQTTSAAGQAQRQDPARGLPGGQLTSGETRQAELAGAGLAETPKTAAELEKYKSQMQTAALATQRAQFEAQKAQKELELKAAEGQISKEKGATSLAIEEKRLAQANVDLDIAKARLALLRVSGGGKTQQPPANLVKILASADQAESYIKSVLDSRGDKGFSAQDVQSLQAMLREAGATALAQSLPGWMGRNAPSWLGGSGKEDVQSMLDSIKNYKKGLEETLSERYPSWEGRKSKTAASFDLSSDEPDDEPVDADIVIDPKDMEEVKKP